MSTLASLRILLGLDSTDVSRGAGRVRGDLKGVQAEANKTRDAFASIKQGIGLGLGLGTFNIAARGAQELTQFIGDSITKASALNETMSKSSVIFGQDAAAVEAWGKTAATAFGQSTGQAIEARATLGNLFKTMGLGQAEVLGMSQNVVELASDLASFNNIGTEEALDKLRSGLVGQAEPLRTLGVQLTEANVKAKAMALGLADANGALSESAKVQARYALILEQTGTAQGDFGRTSEGLANQQKTLAGNMADLSAEFGALIVGPLTSLVKILNDDVIPGLRTTGELIGGVADAARGAAGPVADFIDSLTPDAGFDWRDLLHPDNRPSSIDQLALDFANAAGIVKSFTYETTAYIAAEREAARATAETSAAISRISDTALDAANGMGTAMDAAIALQNELARIERNIEINIAYKVATAPFINPRAAPGTADANRNNAFDSGGDQDALDQANQNFLERDRIAKDQAAREQADRDRVTADNRRRVDTAAADAKREADRRAADDARRRADEQAAADRTAKDRAREYFDQLHEMNQKAIDDIRDRANEELTAQQKAIRGVVSAEQARINAVRAREQENQLRGAVAGAATDEDRTSAQRDLNRFLEDQRLSRMGANADIAVALIDQEKARNDAAAAAATKAENDRSAAQRKAFENGGAMPSVTATSPNARVGLTTGLTSAGDHSHVIHNHLYLDGHQVMDWLERGLANNKAVYNPAPPSASGRV